MATDDCPLPDVAKALSPFIRSRDQVASIRRELQSYLQSELREDETTLSRLNLANPGLRVTDSPTTALTGVRKAYWKALQAHTQAQEKLDALKAELDQIKSNKNAKGNADPSSSSSPNEGYITLLRQREKHRKLKVIDRALANITSPETGSSMNNLEDVVKSKTDDIPTPPTGQLSFNRSPEVEARLMELKKAIVSTKRKTEEQRARMSSPPANGIHQATSKGEVAGLQKALQELTVWMESQLTLIANAEADAQSAQTDQITNEIHTESQISIEDIESLYEQYLETRQRLIETVNDDATAESSSNGISFNTETSGARGLDAKASTKSSAEILLTFVPALIAAKQEEQALVQQTSHTRKQMAIAEDEMATVIRRFAGESHLVQPSASQGSDWTVAAGEAGAATEKYIRERLAHGEQSLQNAEATLELMQSLPQSLQSAVD